MLSISPGGGGYYGSAQAAPIALFSPPVSLSSNFKPPPLAARFTQRVHGFLLPSAPAPYTMPRSSALSRSFRSATRMTSTTRECETPSMAATSL